MISKSQYFVEQIGDPTKLETKNKLKIWVVPERLREKIPCLPRKIYCHPVLATSLEHALGLVIVRGLENQIKTFDGCYNVRPIRGTTSTYSIHSWGLAIDINADENKLGQEPSIKQELVTCFDMWFDWGGYFSRKDGMHFEIKRDLICIRPG